MFNLFLKRNCPCLCFCYGCYGCFNYCDGKGHPGLRRYDRLYRMLELGEERVDKEFNIVKIVRGLRNLNLLMREEGFRDKLLKYRIANLGTNIIDIDTDEFVRRRNRELEKKHQEKRAQDKIDQVNPDAKNVSDDYEDSRSGSDVSLEDLEVADQYERNQVLSKLKRD